MPSVGECYPALALLHDLFAQIIEDWLRIYFVLVFGEEALSDFIKAAEIFLRESEEPVHGLTFE